MLLRRKGNEKYKERLKRKVKMKERRRKIGK